MEGFEHAYFDRGYIDEVWDNHPTLDAFGEYTAPYFTPAMAEEYSVWDKKFFTSRMEESEESLEYLANHPMGDQLKKKRDLHFVYGTAWKSDYGEYRACVESMYSIDKPFLTFADFQYTMATYTEVECDRVGLKCDAVSDEVRYAEIGRCRFFPDWRIPEEVLRDERIEEQGRRAVLTD